MKRLFDIEEVPCGRRDRCEQHLSTKGTGRTPERARQGQDLAPWAAEAQASGQGHRIAEQKARRRVQSKRGQKDAGRTLHELAPLARPPPGARAKPLALRR